MEFRQGNELDGTQYNGTANHDCYSLQNLTATFFVERDAYLNLNLAAAATGNKLLRLLEELSLRSYVKSSITTWRKSL
jgi:hypothetical protein